MKRARRSKSRSTIGVCAVLACVGPVASAETIDWSFETGVQRSDNVERVEAPKTRETIAVAGFVLGVETERPRLATDIAADIKYLEYLDRTFESEVVGGLNGTLDFTLLQERLNWVVQDNFGQIANQRRLPDTPANRQNVNYFTTGPDLTVPLANRTALRLSARYSDIYYQESLEDSEVIGGIVSLERKLSERSKGSLNGTHDEVTYDETELFADVEIDTAYLRYETESSRASLSIDLGYATVDVPDDSDGGYIGRLELSVPVGARSRFALRAGSEFTTSADVLRRNQASRGIEGDGTDDAIASSDAFRSDYAYLQWDVQLLRSMFGISVDASRDRHETDLLQDRERYGAQLGIVRRLSQRLEAEIGIAYSDEEFVNTDTQFSEQSARVGLRWEFSETASVQLQFDHLEGTSNTDTRNYEENRIYVGFSVSRRPR